jgi:magnesium chelatase subunit I
VIHYGIIPRTNRGIFAINELPDLPPRIQVGLLNIMEEKDIQVRGFPVRMQLDILMVYSANPEDYTNRGNIITPLKDRIDSQILTHYPRDRESAVRITAQEAWTDRGGSAAAGCRFEVPGWFRELVEEVAFAARKSEYVNQSSGVSARMSISLLENVLSNMERRAIRHHEKVVHPRISDLAAAVPAITGKIELVYEGEQQGAEIVARKIVGEAVKETFRRFFPDPVPPKRKKRRRAEDEENEEEEDEVPVRPEKTEPSPYQAVLSWFSRGNTLETSDDSSEADYAARLAKVDGLRDLARRHPNLDGDDELPLAMELVIEGLHQHSMVSKWEDKDRASYRDMLKSMFERMGTSSPN